eukprot:1145801-Pelagomonas_calceolata.AAC.1
MSAQELKEAGNKHFGDGEWSQAKDLYTQAIALDPHNAVLFSASIHAPMVHDGKISTSCHPLWYRDQCGLTKDAPVRIQGSKFNQSQHRGHSHGRAADSTLVKREKKCVRA